MSAPLSPFDALLIETAAGEVGVTEEPGNRGVPLMRYGLDDEEPAPWCARFIRWLFDKCGRPLPGNKWKLGSVIYMMQCTTIAKWAVPLPSPGCIVFFATRGDSDGGPGHHVGLVTAIEGDMIQTIEGNAGGGVAVVRNSYRRNHPRIIGFAKAPDVVA